MKEKWTVTDVIYAIQFTAFWLTTVGGIVFIILAVLEKVNFPVWGAFILYGTVEVIQIAFLLFFAKSEESHDEEPAPAQVSRISEDEEVEREIQEIKELKARLKHESELHKNQL